MFYLQFNDKSANVLEAVLQWKLNLNKLLDTLLRVYRKKKNICSIIYVYSLKDLIWSCNGILVKLYTVSNLPTCKE